MFYKFNIKHDKLFIQCFKRCILQGEEDHFYQTIAEQKQEGQMMDADKLRTCP